MKAKIKIYMKQVFEKFMQNICFFCKSLILQSDNGNNKQKLLSEHSRIY